MVEHEFQHLAEAMDMDVEIFSYETGWDLDFSWRDFAL